MYKSIRKKVAESLSKLDSPEYYDWNKWLREPASDDYYIEPVYSTILETDDISIETIAPDTKGYSIQLPQKIKISKAFKQLSITKQKTNKIFFNFPKAYVEPLKEILPQAKISYSLKVSDSDVFLAHKDVHLISELTGAKNFHPSVPQVQQVPLLLPLNEVLSLNFNLTKTAKVYDLLSNLKKEIIEVNLLNSQNFVDPITYSENREIKFQSLLKISTVRKIDVLNLETLLSSINEQKQLVREFKFTQLSVAGMPEVTELKIPAVVKNTLKIMTVKNVKIHPVKVKRENKITAKVLSDVNYFTFENNKREEVEKPSGVAQGVIGEILQPAVKLGKVDKERMYNFLYDYQKPAADFLVENNFVLLNDALGTGKTLEVIGALKILFIKKDISKVIIVCHNEETGWEKKNPELNKVALSGWYNHFREFYPEIDVIKIGQGVEEGWKKSSAIKIMNYHVFLEGIEKGKVSLKDLNHSGCLIIDEFESAPELKLNSLPKYLWLLNGGTSTDLTNKISTLTGSDDQAAVFGRTRKELSDSLRYKTRQDYWIELEKEQKVEYEKALESGRERIYDLVQAGNPFLVQSNVFTLIHQLTQIGNFIGDRESSPKSELLLRHVKAIQSCGEKVLILTQYDRQGTQKLEKLFARHGIKYVLYQTGISLKEMEEAVKRFLKNKSITVFLAGMKAINARINLTEVPYLIHFDQWWSPISTWQAEEKIYPQLSKDEEDKINIYNYLIKDSIEEKIKLKLLEKGLDNKLLFDLLSSEFIYSLISNEDWLELLDLIEPKSESEIKLMKESHLDYVIKLSAEDFASKIKAFIGRIGYKNVSIRTSHNPGESRLFCIAAKNTAEVKTAVQCLSMNVVPVKIVKDFIDSLVVGTDKIFIFTSGEFDKKIMSEIDDERVAFVDKHLISNYLFLFGLI